MTQIEIIKIDGLRENIITDNRFPSFSFSLVSNEKDVFLKRSVLTLFDENKNRIRSKSNNNEEQIGINYDGKELKPFNLYFLQIEVFDNHDNYDSKIISFKTGRMSLPWQAKWVGDYSQVIDSAISAKPLLFKKEFSIKKKVKEAFICATSFGWYDIKLNGKEISDEYFNPGYTDYNKEIQYQIFQLDLKEGKNIILVHVAGGWAVGAFCYVRENRQYAKNIAFLSEIHIRYEDETSEVIKTDKDWLVSQKSCYELADLYDGETFDANVDEEKVEFKNADIITDLNVGKIMYRYGLPVRLHECFEPTFVRETSENTYIFDCKQNFAGLVEIEIKDAINEVITIKHSEILYKGNVYTRPLRSAKATITYKCKKGNQKYIAKFTYMGFRYFEVSGINISKFKVKAFALYSDIEKIGDFKCSNELINKLQNAIVWGAKSNFVDIPTDCPQRDERLGWTGDINLFSSTALFNFDLSRFLDKWLVDCRSDQNQENGGLPYVVPSHWESKPCSVWGDVAVSLPYNLFMSTGNKNVIQDNILMSVKYLEGCLKMARGDKKDKYDQLIWNYEPFSFGDWCAPEVEYDEWINRAKWICTPYMINSIYEIEKMYANLNNFNESNKYKKLKEDVKEAFNKRLVNKDYTLTRSFQTAYTIVLYFNLGDKKAKSVWSNELEKLVKDYRYHPQTGFPGTPYLLFALADNNKKDTAFKVLLNDTCPSWLYMVKTGGTTIWERWDALKEDGTINFGNFSSEEETSDDGGMVSFNHYANGSVGDFLYRRVLGLEIIEPGYKKFMVKPLIGGNITYAKGYHISPYGKIAVDWKIENKKFLISVEVPVNAECVLIMPYSNNEKCIGNGKYIFEEDVREI